MSNVQLVNQCPTCCLMFNLLFNDCPNCCPMSNLMPNVQIAQCPNCCPMSNLICPMSQWFCNVPFVLFQQCARLLAPGVDSFLRRTIRTQPTPVKCFWVVYPGISPKVSSLTFGLWPCDLKGGHQLDLEGIAMYLPWFLSTVNY